MPPKKTSYKAKQSRGNKVRGGLIPCPICNKVGWTLINFTDDTPGGPNKFMVHAGCVKKAKKAFNEKKVKEQTK